jgi:RNA polymerase sigma factor (sigma-70 family)
VEDADPDPRLTQLTAEMAWLRRLARALLRSGDAEDVAQDAWIAAAERGPLDEQPSRPWLSRVVLNLTRMQSRARQRRVAREAATTDFAQPPARPDDLVQRVELQRKVASEVLQLREPYRSTILLHYFEELSCAEIARRLDLPQGTVRRRLKVALDELRARIDSDEQSSGGLAALAPLAGLPVGSSSTVLIAMGVIAMKKIVVAVVVLVLLIVLALMWNARSKPRGGADPAGNHPSGITASAGGTGSNADSAIASGWSQPGIKPRRIAGHVTFRGAPAPGAVVELASIPSEAGLVTAPRTITNAAGEFDFGPQSAMEWNVRASSPGKTSANADIDLRDPLAKADHVELELGACNAAMFGTIRDASGGPISKARIARVPLGGKSPAVPGGPAVTSDDKGAYELCVDAHWPGWVSVEVSATGYGAIWYRAIVPGRVKVDFALVPEATIVGRVIRDDNGEAVPRAYVFVAHGRPGVESAPMRATFGDAAGHFRIDGAAPGRHLVFARAEGMASSGAGTPIVVGVGQTSVEIEIRLEAGSTVRGRVVDGNKPVAGARVTAAEHHGAEATAISQDDGSFTLTGVPRGEIRFSAFPYDVEKPESFTVTERLHDGVVIEVGARGTIIGHAVREQRPLPGASIDLRGPNDDELAEVRADMNGRFEAHGLRPGPWTLYAADERIGAFGRAPATVHLARGQTAEVTIDVAFAASIEGSVIDQNGSPVPGVTVMFHNTKTDDGGLAVTTSDGSYRATTMTGGGQYRPAVARAPMSRSELPPAAGGEFPLVMLADGNAHVTGVVLAIQLDRLAIAGRVVDSDGAPVPDARVSAELVEGNRSPRFASGVQLPADTTTVDGQFTLDDLLAGTYALRARAPTGVEAVLPNIRAGQRDVTLVLPNPGALEVTTVGFKTAAQVTAIRTEMVGAEAPAFATAAGNVYRFKNLSPGKYAVTARSAAEVATTTVQVITGRTARTTLTSGGSGVVAGHVRDFKTQRPVEGMTCRVWPRQGIELAPAPPGEGVRVDAQGAFLMAAAPAGQIAIWCDGLWQNYSNGLRLITLSPSQRTDIDVPVVAWSEEPGTTLGGFGAEFDPRILVPRLVSVKPGGPAAAAGLQDGDVIVAVDGASVTELSPRGAWTLIINRAPGSKVKVTVSRAGKTVVGEVVLGPAG